MSDIATQCSGYADFWEAHRDRAGPLTPADVWGLREDREFQPPSRGHLRRLRRFRPEVFPAEPLREVGIDTNGARHNVNQRIQQGRAVADLCAAADRIK